MYKTPIEIKREFTQKIVVLVCAIVVTLTVGMIFYHISEGWPYLDALYFSAISLTSRGFSEMRPTNWTSLLFSVFYLIIGMGMMIYTISSLVAYYNSYYESKVTAAMSRVKQKTKKKPQKWVLLNPRASKQ